MPVFHLSERTGAQLNHLYHLVKMLTHFYASVLGYLQSFIQHAVELLPSAITQDCCQLSSTPVFPSIFSSFHNLLEIRLNRLYIRFFHHIFVLFISL